MKKTVFTLLIGMIVGILIGSASGAFASIGDRVEAIISEYTIIVDGEQQTIDSSPVAINDSTYVPLRTMANMLGKDVTYKADSKTIEINTPVEGGDTVTQFHEIEEQVRRLEFFNNEIEKSRQDEIESQNKLQSLISELEGNGNSVEEINSHPVIIIYRGKIQDIEKQISSLENLVSEIETHIESLQSQQ